jgi:membrane protein involved in D-alanine export
VIHYADSLYFSILIYPSVIAIALGLFGRLSWRWVAGINLAMVAVQYSDRAEMTAHDTAQKIWLVAAYGLFQLAIARAFLSLRGRRDSRAVFRTAIVAALLPLAIVKFVPADKGGSYINFLGISYATFRSLDVIICIQDRLIEALSPGRYLTYLIFFPSISAGPIDRYRRFLANCERLPVRAEYLKNLDGAVQHVFRGLLYKFILATLLKNYWLDPALAGHGVLSVISYMYAYAFYLFFDFAGYSAFAIGFSYMLGIQTPENFSQPFLATNIVDFWNRWHISLSMWFRDHVYMRFVMASIRNRWFANKLLMS